MKGSSTLKNTQGGGAKRKCNDISFIKNTI